MGNQDTFFCGLLSRAAEAGDLRTVQRLVAKGAELEASTSGKSGPSSLQISISKKGFKPIHHAALSGHSEILISLAQAGANINAQDSWGRTPLYIATLANQLPALDALISLGASIELVDHQGQDCLMVAAQRGQFGSAMRLVRFGANLFQQDQEQRTAICHALESQFESLALAILTKRRNYRLPDPIELHTAADRNYGRVISALIDAGADINAPHNGYTPLGAAALMGHLSAVSYLLQLGANPNQIDVDGSTPLMNAIASGTQAKAVVDTLLEFGAKINTRNFEGETALFSAVFPGKYSLELLEILLKANANPNVINFRQETPLYKAARLGNTPLIKLLLAAGATVDTTPTLAGRSLLDAAVESACPEVLGLLLAAGAEIRSARVKEACEILLGGPVFSFGKHSAILS